MSPDVFCYLSPRPLILRGCGQTLGSRAVCRIAFDGIKGRIDGAKKPFAEPFGLFFAVCEGICKISADLAAVDQRQ